MASSHQRATARHQQPATQVAQAAAAPPAPSARRTGRDAYAGRGRGPEEALELAGMAWAAAAMPSQLSGGQRKLVGLARALASRPRLLCLDEPAAGLDTRESEELGDCLRALVAGGQTTLLIDHDMAC